MKKGDKVKIKNYKVPDQPMVFTVLEVDGQSVKLKHPEVSGYFVFDKDSVIEVIKKNK